MAFALPFFAAMAVVRGEPRRGVLPVARRARMRWKVVAIGFLGYYLASYLDFLGLAYVTASLERLILYLNPTLVLLIGLAVLRPTDERPSGRCATRSATAASRSRSRHDFRCRRYRASCSAALLVFAQCAGLCALSRRQRRTRQVVVGTLRLTAYASCVAFVLLHADNSC